MTATYGLAEAPAGRPRAGLDRALADADARGRRRRRSRQRRPPRRRGYRPKRPTRPRPKVKKRRRRRSRRSDAAGLGRLAGGPRRRSSTILAAGHVHTDARSSKVVANINSALVPDAQRRRGGADADLRRPVDTSRRDQAVGNEDRRRPRAAGRRRRRLGGIGTGPPSATPSVGRVGRGRSARGPSLPRPQDRGQRLGPLACCPPPPGRRPRRRRHDRRRRHLSRPTTSARRSTSSPARSSATSASTSSPSSGSSTSRRA